jgi:ATP-dependent Lon protease
MPIILSSKNEETEKIYPVVSIRDGVVFPSTESVLTFGRPRSLAAVEQAMRQNKELLILMQKDPRIDKPRPEDLHLVGTVVKIERIVRNEKDVNALVRGLVKVKVNSFTQLEPYILVKTTQLIDELEDSKDIEALVKHLSTELKRAVSLGKNIDFLSFMNVMSDPGPSELSNQIASIIKLKPKKKQELLEETNVKKRLEQLTRDLAHELKVLEIERNIASKTQAKFDKSIKEAILRERMKTIEKELGEDTGGSKEIRDLRKKIKRAKMPKEVAKKAKKELKRLSQMSTYNPEASYLRTYLEILVELPWNVKDANNVPLVKAEKVLDIEHYGLNKVKERIIEYLAILKLKQKRNKNKKKNSKEEVQPTILCFVGPPGVGKTSIGRSIANALKRKFVKMSLGGIRDEAEIRGHRRTYVGALPGRIIQGIKQAGTRNPVFMLDEIDKVGSDFRGDPSAALLEALDPEQNREFTDHYLETPFDLSDVFFITTCNILDTIPPALRDRLEIIRFPGYTEDEKFKIAKDYLIDKQLKAHALTRRDLDFADGALKKIISRYTREAGVRNLEREIAKVFRKIARKKAEGKKGKIGIGVKELDSFLGPYKFKPLLAEKEDEVGISTGLFWTEAGGGILFVEVALMPGKGSLKLTGQLGDVMKESAEAALSYVRSRYRELGLQSKFYQDLDIHIHVPEGAVKKDGPSAGIAITTALTSAFTNIAVAKDVGMTGEVTLRGRVLEIGGIKEKIIAAHSAGISTIILPKDNKKDLVEIPKKVRDDLKFVFVDHMDQVLKHALKISVEQNRASRIPLFKQLPKLES